MSIAGIVLLAIPLLAIVYAIALYNGLVGARNQIKNAYSQIDVQFQRRYDLIPNLVESTQAYLKHERETLQAVIQARNQAQSAARSASAHPADPAAITALGGAETALGAALGRFYAVAEAYPELKANQTIQQLMEELATTENKVAFSRQHFNDSVMAYNNLREQFPSNIVAGTFNFEGAKQLEIDTEEARKPVKVSFS